MPNTSRYFLLSSLFFLFSSVVPASADYSKHPQAEAFISNMAQEHQFDAQQLRQLLRQAQKKQSILDAIARPAEKTKQWHEYRKIFVQNTRINQGVSFWQQHRQVIARAAEHYQVSEAIIVAIIGVETRYGRHTGSYRVLDALATLGFDYPRRSAFFLRQLEEFLLLTREQQQDATALKGSYAGAMGYGQFIPSSYRSFAVDFDGDDIADIWHNVSDAVGSVAHYFHAHHWQPGAPVLVRARIANDHDASLLNDKSRPHMRLDELAQKGYTPVAALADQTQKAVPLMFVGEHGKEFWLGFNNFYVITRYNRSHLYAMAVWELSQKIEEAFLRVSKERKRSETHAH